MIAQPAKMDTASDEDTAIENIARRLSGAERARIIRLQVEGCLADLVGGSGDLGQLILDNGSFRVESERPLGDGSVEVAFSARGWRESERLAAEGDGTIPVRGRIELDAALRTKRGADGKTALTPERTRVPPGVWTAGARRVLCDLRAVGRVPEG